MSRRKVLELQVEDERKHPIQLVNVTLRRLEYLTSLTPEAIQEEPPPPLALATAHSPYNAETKSIQVGLRFGPDEQADLKLLSFIVRVEIIGFFEVDTDMFPQEKVEHWAKENAPMLLLPYLREQVFSLSIRADIPPIILPLMQLPSFIINPE
ncbi:MAG: protein-export chaperone SecB [Bacteroidota bacterium]